MALLINQGKHNTANDKFGPIEEDNVSLVIEGLKLDKTLPDTLEVSMRILSGQHKNKYVNDKIPYNPDHPLAWKYMSLRRSAGVPYKKDEAATVDIEELLINRVLSADLKIRKKTNKEGQEQSYQSINYKNTKVVINAQEDNETVVELPETKTEATKVIDKVVDTMPTKEPTPTVTANLTTTSFDDDDWD
jgi:hypothetical protein